MFSVGFLNELRRHEWESILDLFPPGCRILEVGAGTGGQAALMTKAGFKVTAVDIHDSNYNEHRVFPVIDYDGETFPFADKTFDVIFSSNVLEHVLNLDALHHECKRVLKTDGFCIHVLPTHTWRLWTSFAAIPSLADAIWRCLTHPDRATLRRVASRCYVLMRQPRHGERGSTLTELWTFSPHWWRRNFLQAGFDILVDRDVGIFYTGESVMSEHLTIPRRRQLAKALGSACHVFKIRPGV